MLLENYINLKKFENKNYQDKINKYREIINKFENNDTKIINKINDNLLLKNKIIGGINDNFNDEQYEPFIKLYETLIIINKLKNFKLFNFYLDNDEIKYNKNKNYEFIMKNITNCNKKINLSLIYSVIIILFFKEMMKYINDEKIYNDEIKYVENINNIIIDENYLKNILNYEKDNPITVFTKFFENFNDKKYINEIKNKVLKLFNVINNLINNKNIDNLINLIKDYPDYDFFITIVIKK